MQAKCDAKGQIQSRYRTVRAALSMRLIERLNPSDCSEMGQIASVNTVAGERVGLKLRHRWQTACAQVEVLRIGISAFLDWYQNTRAK